ncbi:MAG: GxxExxY protein [Verrucomicrobiota bacterium]
MKKVIADLLYKDECYAIMGACFAAYKEMGCGFVEHVFQECLEIEFADRNIPAIAKPKVDLQYKGRLLKQKLEPDFICYGKIIVELKAVSVLADEHRSQVINYLSATGFKLGLLVNFGHYPQLEWQRIANTKKLIQNAAGFKV